MHTTFERLRELLAEIHDLSAAMSLLEWDMEVMMPPKGAVARGAQLATLAAIRHRLQTSPELARLLDDLARRTTDSDEARLVAEARHDYERATKLPESFVRRFAEAQSAGYNAWLGAKANSDFAAFRPHLETLLELAREATGHYGYEGSPYNALLDNFERGMRAERLRPLLADLAARQKQLVARIVEHQAPRNDAWLEGTWDIAAQRAFSLRVLADMGYDLDAGRLDTAPHPFCTHFDIQDVRITTRYDERDPFSALFSTMHEAGHALYDQGFDPAWNRTPLADAPSLGIHECNSRMWENIVGRSEAFWTHYLPVLREHFPGRLDGVSVGQVLGVVNRVAPSLIRVESDECTYNLHVIARFELEMDLIEGRLAVADLPEAWNARYREYLGIEVPDDAHGCLQDVHWSHGMFGYFPTYTLGNLYAAQVFETACAEMPTLWDDIAAGRLLPLREWLRTKIHLVGRRHMAPDIVRSITGSEPAADAFLAYLERKFGAA